MNKKIIILGIMMLSIAKPGFAQWSWKVPVLDSSIIYYDVHSFDPSSAIVVGSNGRIVKTTDGGNTWISITSGNLQNLRDLFFINSNTGWIVGDYGTILRTDNSGNSWVSQTSIVTSEPLNSVFFIDTQRGWAVGNSTVLHTTDGGNIWLEQLNLAGTQLNSVFFTDSLKGWFVGMTNTFYRTNNGGVNWIQVNPYTNDFSDIFFVDPNNGWATCLDGTILFTKDGGNIWIKASSGGVTSLQNIFFNDSLNGWAVGNAGLILRSNDGGTNWLRQYSSTDNDLYSIFFASPFNGWAVGSIGSVLQYRTDSTSIPLTSSIQTNGDSLSFQSSGTSIMFDPLFTTLTSPVDITIGKYTDGFPIGAEPDTIATIFNSEYWGISCNLDSFRATVCFDIDTNSFHTNALDLLNLVYQCHHGPFWSLVETTPFLSGNQICFSTEHFSNWALGITKPSARISGDTAIENSGNEVLTAFKDFSQMGISASFKVKPGDIDTVTIRKYEVNPGGNLPTGISEFAGSFYKLRKIIPDTIFMRIDPSSISGYSEQDSGMYRILSRKNASSDWNELPTYRVRRGMKENIIIKYNSTGEADFTIGKSDSRLSAFYSNITFDNNQCAGDTVQFSIKVSGGTPPYTFLWYGDDSLSGNQNALEHVYSSIGSYNVNIIIRDSLGLETEQNRTISINCLTGISENIEKLINQFPNPVSSEQPEFYLTGNIEKISSIELFDMKGFLVYKNNINHFVNSGEAIILKNLPPGLYLLKVNGNGFHYRKCIAIN